MAINRSAWGSDERAEYEVMLDAVIESSKNTGDRLNTFERLLNDAVQAHRPWARDVERVAIRAGLGKEIKAHQDRIRAHVSYDGRVLDLPRVQARRVASPAGEVVYQRELIELWTWSEIEAKRNEALSGQSAYTSKIAHYDALLALRDMAPGSTSPVDAARQLETTVDQWLGGQKAA